MIRTIKSDYIKRAMENKGNVTIKYGVFEKVKKFEYVEKKIPILGWIFPFAKRKVQRVVESEKPELVVKEVSVAEAKMLEEKPAALKKELEEMPYTRMYALDPKLYGEGLYLGHLGEPNKNTSTYDIISKDGTILGRFDAKGYYDPAQGMMPAEYKEVYNNSCDAISFDDVVAKYVAKNPDNLTLIPEQVYEKYPNINRKIVDFHNQEEVSKPKLQEEQREM